MTIYSLDILLPNFEVVCCSMSSSNSCFLTCMQVSQEAGRVVWYSHLLKNFPQFVLCHTVKGYGIVNEAEVGAFRNSLAFSMIQWMSEIWSLVPLRLPLATLQSCLVGDPQIGEQWYQRSSHTVVKVLDIPTDFSTWGSGKGTENPQGIWLWMSAGFDYWTSTGLGKQRLLEGTNKTFCTPRPRRKEQWPHKRLSQTCVCVFGSLPWRRELTVAYSEFRSTDSSSPGRHVVLT